MTHDIVGAASTDILGDGEPVGSVAEVVAAVEPAAAEPVVAEPAVVEPAAEKPAKKKKGKKKPDEPVAAEPVVEPATTGKKSKKKKKKPVAKKGKKEGETRGRPPVFVGAVKKEIVRLIKKHGITGTRDILGAKKGELVAHRNAEIITKATKISLPTLVKFGQEAGVELKRGRRKAA